MQVVGRLVRCLPAFHRVHLWQACRLSRDSGPAGTFALVLWSCVPLFCPLSRFVLGALSLNVALFRAFSAFLEGFMGFVWVCLVWGFLWLVGLLCACGVRRIKGLRRICLYFSLFFFFYPVLISLLLVCFSLPLLFSACPLSCLICSCVLVAFVVVSFSLSDYAQKERAQSVCLASSLRVLWVYYILINSSK